MKVVDKVIQSISPSWAVKRQHAKLQLEVLALYGQSSGTGYGNNGASNNAVTKLWSAISTNADSDLVVNRDILVQRSRDLFMSSPLASGALRDIAESVTGGGLTLKSNINYKVLGITHEEAKSIEEKIEFEWNLWADKAYCCDVEATKTFNDMQTLVMLSVLLSGDVFVAMPVRNRKGSIYDLKLKIIESDRVMDPNYKRPDQNILGGIEIDSDGMPKTYYLVNQLPYAMNFAKIQPTKWLEIAAFGSKTGRRNLLHLFMSERPEQRRGVPILSPIIETFKQLTRYSEAEIMAAIVASMFSVFIKKENPTQAPFEGINKNMRGVGGAPQKTEEDNEYREYKLQPGMAMTMKPNESIEIANPARTNNGYGDFVDSILKQVAVGLGVPFEYMMKNMNSSYSASRAAVLLAWEKFKIRRRWLINGFCQPVYEEWLSEAVAKGRVNLPGFFDNLALRAAWSRANFIGNNAIQIDPLKDVEAAEQRVKNGFSTREKEATEQSGMSFDEIVAIRIAEEEQMDQFRRTEKPVYIGTVESSNIANKSNKKS